MEAVALVVPEWQIEGREETEGSCDGTTVEVEGWDSGRGGKGERPGGDTPCESRQSVTDLL